ncbi:hypothetical protein MKX41_12055 [Paenibacillus sp. FSL R5-0475]|uniref:hypothetical protein n=1 Tax=unclassified Paenibacillus TaxID=185978 RepID=UPI0030DBC596
MNTKEVSPTSRSNLKISVEIESGLARKINLTDDIARRLDLASDQVVTVYDWDFGTIKIISDDNFLLAVLERILVRAMDPSTAESDYVTVSCFLSSYNFQGSLPFSVTLFDREKPIWQTKDTNIWVSCNEDRVFTYDEKIDTSDIFGRISGCGVQLRNAVFTRCVVT